MVSPSAPLARSFARAVARRASASPKRVVSRVDVPGTLKSSSTTSRRLAVVARASPPPGFDYTALVAAVREINALHAPTKIDACAQTDGHSLAVRGRGVDGGARAFRLSWHPVTAHVATTSARTVDALGKGQSSFDPRRDNLSFGERANRVLRGKVLLEATMCGEWERACRLRFGERPGGAVEYELLCEVMGRYSNAFLLDVARGETVLACGYQVGEKQTSARRLGVGFAYEAPPTAPGVDPTTVADAEAFESLMREVCARASEREANAAATRVDGCLVRAFRGVSPALAKALTRGAGVADGARVEDASVSDWRAVYDEFIKWTLSVDFNGTRGGRVALEDATWCEEFGQLLLHPSTAGSPLPPPAEDLGADGGPIGALFGVVYGEVEEKDVFERERSRILQAVRARLKKLASKEAGFRKQLDAASGHEEVQARADALMAYSHNYKPGARELEAQDFTTGEPVMIEVDPEKGPVGTAEALYKRTRKLRRTADAVLPLVEQNAAEIEYLRQVEFSIVEADTYASRDDLLFIEEIGVELVDGGYLKPSGKGAEAENRARATAKKKGTTKPKTGKAARKREMMSAIRVYTAPSGKEVYCGRNSRGNEAVSLHFGQDHDVWFHARGAPGAHVILRQQPGDTASDDDIQFAANIAGFHSKLRDGGKVNVSYTSPKYVQKPKGARLGMVAIDRESVIVARPDDVAALCATDAS
jgi:predicted ribosome quality control (RQC) complex YloA/Tae2 family protein